jgi:hypothetical protein
MSRRRFLDGQLVDAADYFAVKNMLWTPAKYGGVYYAVTIEGEQRYGKRHRKRVRMHTLILGKRAGALIDHANGNGLDNRRQNLRWATGSQSGANTSKPVFRGRASTSRYKGVSWNRRKGKWVAQITVNGANKFLGYYNEETAGRSSV